MGWVRRYRQFRKTLELAWRDWRYGRMPVAMITGTSGKTTTSRLVAAILKEHGHRVGLACTDGTYIDGKQMRSSDDAGFKSAEKMLRKYDVTAAVLETARGGLRTQGLFMKRGKVGALLNVGWEHIGIDGIDTVEAMAEHKSQVAVGSRVAVLNGDDPLSARYIDACGVGRVSLFSAGADAPDAARVLAAGGKSVHIDADGYIVVARRGSAPQRVVRVADIPITLGGRAEHYAANCLAATAVADALGAAPGAIARALTAFKGGMEENPGRWSEFDGYPFTVVAERGMNLSAFPCSVRTIRSIPVASRRILLICSVGNRRDAQYQELTSLAAPEFDHFIIYENEKYRRIRAVGEVPALLEAGLLRAGAPPDRIEKTASIEEALERASAMAREGDFIFILTNLLPDKGPAVLRAFARHAL